MKLSRNTVIPIVMAVINSELIGLLITTEMLAFSSKSLSK